MAHAWCRIGSLSFVVFLLACAQAEQLGPMPIAGSTDKTDASTNDMMMGGDNGCPADTPSTCGNGQIEMGEACDEGNPEKGIDFNFGTASCKTVLGTNFMGPLQCSCCVINTDMCVEMAPPMGGTSG